MKLFKPLLRDVINISVLLGMTYGCLLQLGAFDGYDHVFVSPFEHLNQNYHFFVLHEVVGADLKIEWVVGYQLLNLIVQLGNTGLIDVTVTSGVVFVGRYWVH